MHVRLKTDIVRYRQDLSRALPLEVNLIRIRALCYLPARVSRFLLNLVQEFYGGIL